MSRNRNSSGVSAVGLALIVLIAGARGWCDTPETVNIHGQLLDVQGQALSGTRGFTITFYSAVSGGAMLGTAVSGTVGLSAEGVFNIPVTLPAAAYTSPQVWYEIAVDSDTPPNGVDAGDAFPNRVKLESVPFARQASEAGHVDAASVGTGTVDNTELDRLDGVTGGVQTQIDAKADTSAVNASQAAQDTVIADKADAASVYTKGEVDTSQAAQDTVIAGKADAASVYTKGEVDTSQAAQDTVIAGKADAASVYTKGEVDTSQSAQDAVIAGKLPREGESFVVVEVTSNAVTNGTNLLAAYATAKVKTPYGQALSATNRVAVLVPPGQYDCGVYVLNMHTEFVDLIGVSSQRECQVITSMPYASGFSVISQRANDVRIENLTVRAKPSSYHVNVSGSDPAAYSQGLSLNLTQVRNCTFWADEVSAWSMHFGAGNGTFVACTAGSYAFGASTCAGTFIDCIGGDNAFGGNGGNATGTFTNCTGGDNAFGGNGGNATGTFTNCTGGTYAFGGNMGSTLGAKLYGCRMIGTSWNAVMRGRMEDCHWSTGITLGNEARLYDSFFHGRVDLDNTTAGVANCCASNQFQNVGSASFNQNNLYDPDVQ